MEFNFLLLRWPKAAWLVGPTALPPLCRRAGAWPLHRPRMAVARGVQSLCTGGADIPHKTSHGTTADNRADPTKRNAPKWRARKRFPHGEVFLADG
ncbi:hypothetical protein KZY59_08320 [Prevotella buccae]|uniref:hypothetical protein n=1 Tax=Segatella buccae TaxID=28126 RepID=UPI001C5EC438|nr:hypothetical protein [Segatella buccae]MBW4871543.1 hypothetical protein [Segatella buccae]